MQCNSLAPLIDENSKILILGSMHGVKSLKKQQYYAHPQNRFWKLITLLFNEKIDMDCYESKTGMLMKHGIALWETLAYCEREGSLDSNIEGERPNDIIGLLKNYPSIKTIICNGGKASKVLKKHTAALLPGDIKVYYFHSTSPANARMKLLDLVAEWQEAVKGTRY